MKQTGSANQCSLSDYSSPSCAIPLGKFLVFLTFLGLPVQRLNSKQISLAA